MQVLRDSQTGQVRPTTSSGDEKRVDGVMRRLKEIGVELIAGEIGDDEAEQKTRDALVWLVLATKGAELQ